MIKFAITSPQDSVLHGALVAKHGMGESATPINGNMPPFFEGECSKMQSFRINRNKPGKAFIINLGGEPVHVTYEKDGAPVGPETDYIQPGGCKEIGGGPGVTWILSTA